MTSEIVRIRRRNTVLAALEAMRQAQPGLSLTSVRVFLYVAENPGISVSELSQVCQVTDATASRVARGLAGPDIDHPLAPSLDLVDFVSDERDPRQRSLRVSARGEVLVARIDKMIRAQSLIAIPHHEDAVRITSDETSAIPVQLSFQT